VKSHVPTLPGPHEPVNATSFGVNIVILEVADDLSGIVIVQTTNFPLLYIGMEHLESVK
jgi:hypothetical protein